MISVPLGNRHLNDWCGHTPATSDKGLTVQQRLAIWGSMKRAAPAFGDVDELWEPVIGLATGTKRDSVFLAGLAFAPPVDLLAHDVLSSSLGCTRRRGRTGHRRERAHGCGGSCVVLGALCGLRGGCSAIRSHASGPPGRRSAPPRFR